MRIPLLCLLALPLWACAQDYVAQSAIAQDNSTPLNIGLGIGLDYGAIGVQFQFRPEAHVALFAGVGYALVGAGYNAGVNFRILPDKRACPFISAMYGYNAVVLVKGASQYNQIYYGSSFGAGVELRKRSRNHFWRIELLIPQRPAEFHDDYEALKLNPLIKMGAKPPGFAISGGFHWAF
jgi:hypothetical protein